MKPGGLIRVGMVTDCDLLAAGARAALSAAPNLTWVGQTAERYRTEGLAADVLLVDEAWTATFGDLTSRTARLLFVGAPPDGRWIADRLAQNAAGYLHRADDLLLLLPSAVQLVRRRQVYLSPTAMAEYLTEVTAPATFSLCSESRSVLRLLGQGMTVGAIAAQLGVPVRRVYWVREKLRRKLGAVTNEHLIQRAAQEGVLMQTDGL